MEVSVCIPVYNALPAVQACLEAAIESTGEDTEILLVYNHPPYREVWDFLAQFKHRRLQVLDPGTNLGCEGGVNYGFARAEGKFLVKLDDDILVPAVNWAGVMRRSLSGFPRLAYVALPWPQINTGLYRRLARPGYTLEVCPGRIYSGCQMIRQKLWENHFRRQLGPRLYASIEEHYLDTSRRLGMDRGYLLSHPVRHLSRTEFTDPLYGVWKIFYARELTKKDFTEWRKDFRLEPAEYSFLNETCHYSPWQLDQLKQLVQELPSG